MGSCADRQQASSPCFISNAGYNDGQDEIGGLAKSEVGRADDCVIINGHQYMSCVKAWDEDVAFWWLVLYVLKITRSTIMAGMCSNGVDTVRV